MSDEQKAVLAQQAIQQAMAGLQPLFDLVLIVITLHLVFNFPWFAGGWGWFLLLGLSPRAHVTRIGS